MKKNLFVIIVLGFFVVAFSLGVCAESIEQNGIIVDLQTDKDNYVETELVTAVLTLTNTNETPICDINLEYIIPEGMRIHESSESSMNIDVLEAGDTISLKIQLVKDPENTIQNNETSYDIFSYMKNNPTVITIAAIILGTVLVVVFAVVIVHKIRYSVIAMALCVTMLFSTMSDTILRIQAFEPECKEIRLSAVFCIAEKPFTLFAIVTFDSNKFEAHSHDFGEWIVESSPSCTEKGLRERSCATCAYVESEQIPCIPHDYSTIHNLHLEGNSTLIACCSVCGLQQDVVSQGSLMNDVDNQELETRLWDCGLNFSFDIVCDKDETYILNNIIIVDSTLKYAPEDILDHYRVDVLVEQLNHNQWRVSPQTPYEENNGYLIRIPDDMSFVLYPGNQLSFRTCGEEKKIVKYSNDIIYLRELENHASGYYPYSYEYNDRDNKAYVTVSQKGSINEEMIGKLFCVGECTDLNDVIGSEDYDENISVGLIERIYEENGKTVIVLGPPEFQDLFDDLDIHSNIIMGDTDQWVTEELKNDMINQLMASDGFAKILAVQTTMLNDYADSQGWGVEPLRIEKNGFTFAPEIDDSEKDSGRIKIVIPVTFAPTAQNIKKGDLILGHAQMCVCLTLTVSFSMACTTNFEDFLNFWNKVDVLNFNLHIVQDTHVDFDFNISIKMDYDYEPNDEQEKKQQKLLIVNPQSQVIHRDNCRMCKNFKDNPQNQKSYDEIYQMFGDRIIQHECDWCQPFTRDGSLFVKNMNLKSGMYHCISCTYVNAIMNKKNILILSSIPVIQSEIIKADNGKESIYCSACRPYEEINNRDYFNDVLKNGDWEDTFEEIKGSMSGLFDVLGTESVDGSIDKKNSPISCVPGIFTIFELNIYLSPVIEFDLDAQVDFAYDFYHQYVYDLELVYKDNQYSVEGKKSKGVVVDENGNELKSGLSLDMKGSAGVNLGIELMLKFNVCFAKDHLYIALGAEVGLYAEISGILHFDDIEGDGIENYYAAYLEAGIYCQVYCQFNVIVSGDRRITLVDKKDARLALIKAGDKRVYYGFENYSPEKIMISQTKSYRLSDGLLMAKYVDLTNDFKAGNEQLSFSGGADYEVVCRVLDTKCSPVKYVQIDKGKITISDDAPNEFTVNIYVEIYEKELKIPSNFQEYVKYVLDENSVGNGYFVGTLVIPVQYTQACLHDMMTNEVKQYPTCKKEGIQLYSCVCGHTEEHPIPTVDHTFENGICTICGHPESVLYVEKNGHTYVLYDIGVTWHEAKELCEELGGHLVTITSAEEQALIEQLISYGEKKQYWIGLDTHVGWVTGEAISYTNWDVGQPDNLVRNDGEIEHYGQIYNQKNPSPYTPHSQRLKWNDIFFDNTRELQEDFFVIEYVGFICEIEDSSIVDKDSILPSNYHKFNGHYYKVISGHLNWQEADTLCREHGGYLCTITSPEEQEFVSSLVTNADYACWLGGYYDETNWKWVTGEKFAYTNWDNDEPSHVFMGEKEEFLGIYANDKDTQWSTIGKWNDFRYNSDTLNGYVCEWDCVDDIIG